MPIDLIIRNAAVAGEKTAEKRDLFIDGGKFVEQSDDARETMDGTGLLALPGVIDSHVHFNEPGREDWEGFATGSSAAAAGGVTLVADMPLNSSPPTLTAEEFDKKVDVARAKSVTDFAIWGGLTPTNIDHLEALADRGVIGFKAFLCGSGIDDFLAADDWTLMRGMILARQFDLPVAVHAENHAITAGLAELARKDGRKSAADYLRSRPVLAELEATQRAILMAGEIGCRLHIVHVTSPRVVELVVEARANDIDVTCETCPHYLTFTADDVIERGAALKCSPPIRSGEDRDALWRLLLRQAIDFVASDHSPAPQSMKEGDDFFSIWGGISGVQSTLAVMMSQDPPINPALIARLTASYVAERYRLVSKGRIEPGLDADLVLLDPASAYTLRSEMLLDRHKLSPYVGRTFRGTISRTILRGETIVRDGKVVAANKGQLVKPNRG